MITAIFNNKMDSTVAYGLWQWDYGQVLRIKGIDFSQFAIEIHFSFNEDDEDSTIAVGVVKEVEYESTILDDGETKVTSETVQVLDVTIPKDFLWNRNKKNYTIYVFLHLSNEEIGHTVKKILLPVKIKARPTYPHASEDEALFHSTLEQINELAETTVENAKMAKSYAVGDTGVREGEDTDNAKYYAEQASASLEEATLQAENAEQSANNAKEYEENAELSANKAKEYELSSKTNADNAQGYMDWAYEYKDNAQEYSISARDYRDEAESAKNISLQASIDTGKVRDEVKGIQTDVKNIQTQINNIADSVDNTVIEINGLVEQVETNAETVATNTEITNQNKVATNEAKATAEEVLASSRQINADVLEIKNQIMGFVDGATRIVDEGIAEHDTSSTAHDDIRQLIVGLNDRLNTVLNSDDETLDQLSEIVDYIKDNRDLIDTITSSKVNVNDIIDNLITTSSNKPLSAKQGKVLKDLIDAIVIPTKVSAFVNDKGYLTEQVQTNWTEEDSINASFIQNKPNIKSGTGTGSIIEGSTTGDSANVASKTFSHAEGMGTTSSGNYSHAEGLMTESRGAASHAEGSVTLASGNISHAEGLSTIASSLWQHVQGKLNIEDKENKYAHIVGNGDSDSARSNAHTLDWSGNAWYAGKVTADGTPTEDNDLVPKSYVDGTLTDYVKNTDYATANKVGVVQTSTEFGTIVNARGIIGVYPSFNTQIKNGTDNFRPVVPHYQHEATFYGLAKASGDTTQSASDNAIGNYTDEAKASIQEMLDVPSTKQLEDYTTLNTFYDDVIDNTASGNNIVSFNDGANNLPIQDLTINIEPSQDLHGYDSPWASGCGINICPTENGSDITTDWTYENPNYKMVFTGLTASSPYTLSATVASGIEQSTTARLAIIGETNGFIDLSVAGRGSKTINSTSEGTIIISLNKNSAEVADIVSKITQIQLCAGTETAFHPYSNICPISGWEEMVLTHGGANLLPSSVPSNMIAGTISGGKIISAANARLFAVPVPKNTTIHIQKKSGDRLGCSFWLMDTGTPQVGTPVYKLNGFTNVEDATITTGEHGWLGTGSSTLDYTQRLLTDRELMVSIGNSRKDYVAPQATPITIDFGQTVYGGVLDVLKGTLKINKQYVECKRVDNKAEGEDGYFWYTTSTALGIPNIIENNVGLVIDRLKIISGVTQKSSEGTFTFYGTQIIRWKEHGEMTLAEYKEYLAENPLHFVYEIADPIEIQLDPHTLNTLLGYNNIYTDVNGNISTTYKANTKAYIDNKVMDNVPDLTLYVKNTNYATTTVGGVVKVSGTYGSGINSNGILYIYKASDAEVKAGTDSYKPITPNSQHRSVFYGLAKASGDTTQASSANAIGVYTNDAKTKIKTMLDIPTKTSELTNDSNFINTSYQIYATDDDNGNVTIHFGIPS